ncbi:MAG TPA: MASE1 domain-containing protein [Candidatus Saccharimonadales bacterium]|nr:MASE1 domain-containing protein [Candidatus Saccharimonadales bacterium]
MRAKLRYLAYILALAALYLGAAKLGLTLAFTVKQITTVWPPTGLALVALFLYGYKLWPGVLLGAFVANLLTAEPAGVAFGIAIGNTLEAVVGVWLLSRVVRLQPALNRVKDVVGLVILAALVSTMISASIGTVSLALGGLLAWAAQPRAWLLWWFGDMAGDLLFAPFLLVWFSGWRQLGKRSSFETSALLGGATLVSIGIFFGQFSFLDSHPPVTYLMFPFVVWAAFRFKQLGVTAVSLITSVVAVLGTIAGLGPFAGSGTPQQQLIALFLYIILMTTSGLFMAVAVLQREASEQKLLRQAKDLKVARNKIRKELAATTQREAHLKKSNEGIIDILDQMLDETPSRLNNRSR